MTFSTPSINLFESFHTTLLFKRNRLVMVINFGLIARAYLLEEPLKIAHLLTKA